MKLSLNDKVIESLEKGRYFDTLTKGLGVTVGAKGRSWFVLKQVNGKRQLITLGTWPDMTVKDARIQAMSTIVDLETKGVQAKRATLENFYYQLYKPKHLDELKDTSTHSTWKRILADIGRLELNKITLSHLNKLKSSCPTPSVENKVHRQLSGALNKAKEWGELPIEFANPCEHSSLKKLSPRQTYLDDDKIRRMLEVLDSYPNVIVRSAVKLLLLTGCRTGEVLKLKWTDVNDSWLHIGKTKNGTPHRVPITPIIQKSLDDLPKLNDWVFPSPVKKDDHIKSFRADFKRIKKQVGVTDLTKHDIRRTVATMLVNSGVSMDEVANALNHKSIETTRKHYAVFAQANKSQALNTLSDLVSNLGTTRHSVSSTPQST